MRVAFDVGPVKSQPAGVGLYATALSTALSAVLPNESLVLIGRRPDAANLPAGVESRGRAAGVPYPAWIELSSARDAKRAGADITHYSDGLAPLVRHGRTVLAVHDLSAFRLWRSHPVRRWARIPLVLGSPHLADLVLVPSKATADEVIRWTRLPARRIEVVPYAPQADARQATSEEVAGVTARLGLAPHRYILALGTIEPRKNHVRVIAAFEDLVRRRALDDDVRLVIAGRAGWRSEPVEAAIEASAVRSRIDRLGYVPGEALAALVTGAGAAIYVSTYEGFGLPVVEAMACGAPIVTSNVSSMPEVAGDASFLVNPFDVNDIARALADVFAASAAERREIGERSRAHASRFTWSAAAERIGDLYRSLA